ncbi:nuclear transport factor 2 family protein [Nocardioides terrigena]|uniref:nuclear transport factor 2 family protein n=1 Tax=Nocardioides terrigena TaxID=424797 RepID=UPI000D317516|nr:nuclear transport factor 2 family protein [Nocardioides terrigena]
MDAASQVIEAAEARALALADGDADRLVALLHPEFRWTAHVGETYDRAEYVRRNTEGHTVWRSQTMLDPHVVVVDDTAVLRCEVTDVVLSGDDEPATFRMPMTQVWVRTDGRWSCLGGHAGPRRSPVSE